jgi:hypothetical protein
VHENGVLIGELALWCAPGLGADRFEIANFVAIGLQDVPERKAYGGFS